MNYSSTNLRRHCTSNVGKRLWNDLPVDLKNISSIYLIQKEHEVQFFARLLNRGEEVYIVNFSVFFCL